MSNADRCFAWDAESRESCRHDRVNGRRHRHVDACELRTPFRSQIEEPNCSADILMACLRYGNRYARNVLEKQGVRETKASTELVSHAFADRALAT